MTDTIAQRLASLRKHLSDRIGQELSLPAVAEQCELKDFMIQRMEKGLNGSTETLVVLLNFYRDKGYNLDWILRSDNSHIPMMVTASEDMLKLNEEVLSMKQSLTKHYNVIAGHLSSMGFLTSEPQPGMQINFDIPEAPGVEILN